jgi:hypothetical protein
MIAKDGVRARPIQAATIHQGWMPRWFERRLVHVFDCQPSVRRDHPTLPLVAGYPLMRLIKQLTLNGPLGERFWFSYPWWLDSRAGAVLLDETWCFAVEPLADFPLSPSHWSALRVPVVIAAATNCRLLSVPETTWRHISPMPWGEGRSRLIFMPGCLFPMRQFRCGRQPR